MPVPTASFSLQGAPFWLLLRQPFQHALLCRIKDLPNGKVEVSVQDPVNSTHHLTIFSCPCKVQAASVKILSLLCHFQSLSPNKALPPFLSLPSSQSMPAPLSLITSESPSWPLSVYLLDNATLVQTYKKVAKKVWYLPPCPKISILSAASLPTLFLPHQNCLLTCLTLYPACGSHRNGWKLYTNAVAIFHKDVTFILEPEIPHIVWPFINDYSIKGPATCYKTSDGAYETLAHNPSTHKFIWQHLLDVYHILHHLCCAGATISAKKLFIAMPEVIILGHKCNYEGHIPDDSKISCVWDWPSCKNLTNVCAFLGTTGFMHI